MFSGNFGMSLGVFVGTWPNPPLQIRVRGREARTTAPSARPVTHTTSHRSKEHRGSVGSRPIPLRYPGSHVSRFAFSKTSLLLPSALDEAARPQSPHHLQDTFNQPQ